MKTLRKVLHTIVVASAVVFTGLSDVTRAADLSISKVPLFLGGNAAPNIMFTLDDSGSMQFEVLPDELIYKDIRYLFPIGKTIYGAGANQYYRAGGPTGSTSIANNCGSGTAFSGVCVPGYEDNNLYNYKYRSVFNNKSYYNPDLTYTPWSQADGTTFYPNAVPACAEHHPVTPTVPTVGCRNLTLLNNGATNTPIDSYAKWLRRKTDGTYEWFRGLYANAQTPAIPATGFWPATYFNFDTTNATCGGPLDFDNRDCYDKVEVMPIVPNYTSPGGVSRTYAEEIQNFANWYTYYRSRVLLARAGAGRAFANQSGGLRVGFAAINKTSATIDGVSSPGALVRGVRSFSGTDRNNFFNDLYGHAIPTLGTPLRRALDDVGKYFSRTDAQGPWAEVPGTSGGTELACRQSYNILTTDGYWNAAAAPTTAARGNVDNTAGPLITNHSNPPEPPTYQYSPVAVGPYKDAWGDPNPHLGTLADVAMYYWNRDLRSSLANKVPTNKADPAFWQHMVTFTVGLGLSGTLDPDPVNGDLPLLTDGTKTWPMPWNSNPQGADPTPPASWQEAYNLDDLWHAAVNGRGDFFSASNPEKFAQGLSASLANISGRSGSASSIALNSTSLQAGSSVYQARFNSADWSGQLLSIPIKSNGTLDFDPTKGWDAAVKLAGQDYDTGRNIVTFKPLARTGAPFRFAALDASQSSQLNINPQTLLPDVPTPRGSERVDYLRGKDVAGMRPRAQKLGDIVHSSPAYVGAPFFRYPDTWAGAAPENGAAAPYSMFKSNNKNRKALVYAGANDGMLHAFDADASTSVLERGKEVFAYVPAAVYKNLNQLTNPTYAHRFFVDGAPTVGDAFFSGSWHTVLVGGLRAGGQAIYALDITDPVGDEVAIATKVLWEFNDVEGLLPIDPDYGDKDLGDTFSEPNIVRMKNGEWAAVFGNGYNNTASDGPTTTSATGNAVLYIVNIKTGALIKKIDTGVGKLQDPKNTTAANQRPNGLATPAPIDVNGDFIVDYIYAGDLFGNLWKFDVSSSDPNMWKVLGPGSPGGPLFVACAGTGTQCTTPGASNLRQPITTRPQVGRHPTKANGFMVYFGTGKYIEGPDIDAKPTGQTTQTFYGVWDENQSTPTAFDRSNLLQQKILKEVLQGFDADGTVGDDAFFELRVTTDDPINWDTAAFHKGWYMDLINTGESPQDNEGERQVTDSILRDGRIIFTTLIPSADPCDFGGTGWLMELDAKDGSRLEFSPFDLNADGKFDGKDHVKLVDIDGDGILDPVPPSGKKSKVGIPPTPGIVSDSGDPDKPKRELKLTSGSTGEIEVTIENPGVGNVGRRSWRELQLQ